MPNETALRTWLLPLTNAQHDEEHEVDHQFAQRCADVQLAVERGCSRLCVFRLPDAAHAALEPMPEAVHLVAVRRPVLGEARLAAEHL